jgi:hypothetical protein
MSELDETEKLQVAAAKEIGVQFHFEKSNSFRVIYADGAIGGVAPKNDMLRLAFYNDRSPIPKSIVHALVALDENHKSMTMGKEIVEKRVSKTGIFREVEVEVVMTLQTARDLRVWLNAKITEMESRQKGLA